MTTPPPASPYQQPLPPLNPADERLWSTLIHVGGIFFSFVPALVGYLALKDRGPFIRAHSATALNFHLTMLIVLFAGSILTIIVVGIFVLMAAVVLIVVFGIIAAIAANNGQFYNYPLTITFVR